MKLYLWKRVDHATDNYHEEGAVLVFANSPERAVELAAIRGAVILDKPDLVEDVSALLEEVYIFPDSGCC